MALKFIIYIYQKQDIYLLTSYTSYISVSSKPSKTIESSKVWKKPKYSLLRKKCLVFDIYIHIYIIYI